MNTRLDAGLEGVAHHRVSSAASKYNAHLDMLESIFCHSVS
eukprot:COSAG05_NODE_8265_length_720_cov_1.454106_2_plen_40_part_01